MIDVPEGRLENAVDSRAPHPSAAGACAKRNVDKDDDDYQKSKTPHCHHAGMRDRPRSLRFDPGHGGDGGDDHCQAEPHEPVHDSACYKIHASRARSESGLRAAGLVG
jgi:hypothetical protein